MSRSATPATRNEATRRLKPPKMIPPAELPIGTAIWSSRGRLRTVAIANATLSEHTLNPQTPRVKREPLLRIRENERHIHHMSESNHISTNKDLQQHRYQTSCLDQQHSRACDICLNICHEHSTIAILQYI